MVVDLESPYLVLSFFSKESQTQMAGWDGLIYDIVVAAAGIFSSVKLSDKESAFNVFIQQLLCSLVESSYAKLISVLLFQPQGCFRACCAFVESKRSSVCSCH